MNIAIIIPHRGDRPKFLANCLRMMEAQTLKPAHIELINEAPQISGADITWRYRNGYERLRNKGYDLIALIEDDDYYQPYYLEEMVENWEARRRPDIFGTMYTIYYHIKLRKYFQFRHNDRASAMNTMLKPNLKITWPRDEDPFTDMWIWTHKSNNHLQRGLFMPNRVLAVGIKHGVGMCGGRSHVDRLQSYINEDNGFLEQTLDPISYKFYSDYGKEL